MIIILVLTIFSLLALIIHGNPPVHYLVTTAPLLTILVAYVISKLKIKLYLIIIILVLVSCPFYFSDKWFYKQGNYNKQVEVVKEIIKDANGRKFNLKRVGEFDYYNDDYAQNYQYLMWIYGNEPVKSNEVLKYTIYDQDNNLYFKKE